MKEETVERFTVEFPEEISEKLTELSKSENRTKAEILRRAIGLYAHLVKEMPRTDDTFLVIMDKDRNILSKIMWR